MSGGRSGDGVDLPTNCANITLSLPAYLIELLDAEVARRRRLNPMWNRSMVGAEFMRVGYLASRDTTDFWEREYGEYAEDASEDP